MPLSDHVKLARLWPTLVGGLAALTAIAWWPPPAASASGEACETDADCGAKPHCSSGETCRDGACAPGFSLPHFPIEADPPVDAYSARLIALLDHSGSAFYTNCCDTEIVAFSGETGVRGPDAVSCPLEPKKCFDPQVLCLCGYSRPEGGDFEVTEGYLGGSFLIYDGHAGYDYSYGFGTRLVATRGGTLCKARRDFVNSTFFVAWERFHTFYVDHGIFDGTGYASWYLHAADLAGEAIDGSDLSLLEVGGCADVEGGKQVATVGNFGTFAPHLHFELRSYDPADGPESFTTRVVDPYGWRGDGTDPFLDPGSNVQTAYQEAPLWGCRQETAFPYLPPPTLPEPGRGLLAAGAAGAVAWLRRGRLRAAGLRHLG